MDSSETGRAAPAVPAARTVPGGFAPSTCTGVQVERRRGNGPPPPIDAAGRPARRALVAGLAVLAILAAAVAPADAAAQAPPDCPAGLELLVERSFAADAGLSPGDTIHVGTDPAAPCGAVVAGVYEPPADPATLTRGRPRLLFHLPDLGRLAGRPDEVDRFTVALTDGADPSDVAARIGALMPGARVLSADELAAESSATFEVIQRFHRAIGWITLGASGVFLVCVMTLRIQQRRTPIAALRLTGVSRRTLAGWLLLESTVVAVVGGAAGLVLGRLASSLINRFYQARYDTTLLFSIVGPDALIPAVALAVVLGIGAGAVALAYVFRTDPLTEVGR